MKLIHHRVPVFFKLTFLILMCLTFLYRNQGAHAYVGLCCGKCGGNMPLIFPGSGVPEMHEWRVKLNQFYTRQEGLLNKELRISNTTGLANYMMVPTAQNMTMTNISVGYAPTEKWSYMVMAMYMDMDMDMLNRTDQKTKMTSSGVGDFMVMAKRLLYADDILIPSKQLSLILGVSMPSGSIDKRNDRTLLPYSMQLGSGTVDPIFGISGSLKFDPWWFGSTVQYKSRLYKNSKGYRFGNEFKYDFFAMRQMKKNFLLELQIEGKWQGKLRGEADETRAGVGHINTTPAMGYMSSLWDPDNYGQNQVLLTGGFQWQPRDLWIVELNYGQPVYFNKRGIQLEDDYRAVLTIYAELPTPSSRRYKGEKNDDQPDALGF